MGASRPFGIAPCFEQDRMKVAVPIETVAGERRVALTPEAAAALVKGGMEILLEPAPETAPFTRTARTKRPASVSCRSHFSGLITRSSTTSRLEPRVWSVSARADKRQNRMGVLRERTRCKQSVIWHCKPPNQPASQIFVSAAFLSSTRMTSPRLRSGTSSNTRWMPASR